MNVDRIRHFQDLQNLSLNIRAETDTESINIFLKKEVYFTSSSGIFQL